MGSDLSMKEEGHSENAPSKRPDFVPIQTSEVLDPKFLPEDYSWMDRGHYALYTGHLTEGGNPPVDANWAWEVDYVKGTPKEGKISCLGYTLFLERESESLGNWLNWPILFVCFFRAPQFVSSIYLDTPLGKANCLKVPRSTGDGYVTATLYYEKRTMTLVKMEVHSDLDGKQLYSGTISETNINIKS